MRGGRPRRGAVFPSAWSAFGLCVLLAGCGEQGGDTRGVDPTASTEAGPATLASLAAPLPRALADGLDLPRVGTIGDLPPEARRIVVRIDATGALAVDGRATEEGALAERLRARIPTPQRRPLPDAARVDLLLAVDRAVPWAAVSRVIATAARRTGTDRLHFLVLSEGDDEPGAMATFLPGDHEGCCAPVSDGARVRVGAVLGDGPGSAPAALLATLRALPAERRELRVTLAIEPLVPVGSALAIADVVFRAGFSWVAFEPATGPLAEGSIRDLVARARDETRAVRFEVDGAVVSPSPPGAPTMPSVVRVVGRPAGDWAPRAARPAEGPSAPSTEEEAIRDAPLLEEPEQVHPPQGAADGRTLPAPRAPAVRVVPRRARSLPRDASDECLHWLAAHQSPDGRFEAQGFGSWCRGERNVGEPASGAGLAARDVETTSLALLAFLGAGYSSRSEGPFGKTVSAAARWLVSRQDTDGAFGVPGDPGGLRDHACATLALVSLSAESGSRTWVVPAQRAIDFAASVRLPGGGWGTRVGDGEGDPVTTAWTTMAFVRARAALAPGGGPERPLFAVDAAAIEGARALAASFLDPGSGRAQAAPDDPRADRATPAALVALRLAGEPADAPAFARGAAFLATVVPSRESPAVIDAEAAWFGTLAAFHFGQAPWKAWGDALRTSVIDAQVREGDVCGARGSWDPVGPGALEGGRVAFSALLALCSEVYYRYDRVPGTVGVRWDER